jgi:hypothetical protein
MVEDTTSRRKALKMFGATAGIPGLTGCLSNSKNETDNKESTNLTEDRSRNVEAEKINHWKDFKVDQRGKIEPLPFLAYHDISDPSPAYMLQAYGNRDAISAIRSWAAVDEELDDLAEFPTETENDIVTIDKNIDDGIIVDSDRGYAGYVFIDENEEIEQIVAGLETPKPNNSELEYPKGRYIIEAKPENIRDVDMSKEMFKTEDDPLISYSNGDGKLDEDVHHVVNQN